MAGYPPPYPPPGYDPRAQRRFLRDQARAQRAAFRAQREQMRYQMRGMRRGSILGPILLIAIGIIFFLIQTGRLNHDRFWGWYTQWWPLLLVGAGLIVLAEWAFDQHQLRDPQHPRYRRSLGSGVFFLIFFFVVAGVVASNVHEFPSGTSRLFPGYHFDPDSWDAFFGDKHESDQNVDFAFPAGESLSVVNPRGDVTVSGTSDDNRIHIAIHKQVFARTDSDAESKAQRLAPTTNADGSVFKLALPFLDGARADLVVSVPATAATTVNANRGDVHIASIKAPVAVIANHGDIDLSAITGATTAHINSGGSSISAHSIDGGIAIQGHAQDVTLADITGPVSISGDFYGTTHLQHINGAIHFHTGRADFQLARLDGEAEIVRDDDISADQALGPLAITTRNGNVTLDRIAGDIAVTDHNGTIDLTAAPNAGSTTLGTITLEDRNGSIRATLPEKAAFSVQADTSNGEIDTDFPLAPASIQGDATRGDNSGRENHKTLSGSVGGGGPLVHIITTNGDISIHKGDVQPLAPVPPPTPKITLVPPAPTSSPHKKH